MSLRLTLRRIFRKHQPALQEDDSPDDGATTSTGGGVRLAASPTSRVNGVLVGLVMAAGFGAFRVL